MEQVQPRHSGKRVQVLAMGMGLAVVAASAATAQQPKTVPPGTPVTISVVPAQVPAPPVSITLAGRHGHVTPVRRGCTHSGGGNIDVAQPSSDALVVTMSGVAVAYGGPKDSFAGMDFNLDQSFEISFDNPKVKKAKVTLEARVIGLLRSHSKGGGADYDHACASVAANGTPVVSLCLEPHSVAGGENLSVNDHDGPLSISNVAAGKYTLHQTFAIHATAPKSIWPFKAPSAEFAPDPALDPLWISYKEPFHGAAKKDFGFQVTVKVADATE
jgi:hypothetical protein